MCTGTMIYSEKFEKGIHLICFCSTDRHITVHSIMYIRTVLYLVKCGHAQWCTYVWFAISLSNKKKLDNKKNHDLIFNLYP